MFDGKAVLLIEDERATAPSVRAALGELGVSHAVVHVTDADEALEMLRAESQGLPSVILLDGSQEQTNGLAVIKALKRDERFRSIPVITLAPSGDATVINKSFELGAAGYVVKSPNHEDFVEAVRAVHQYWTLSELPVGA
ncbi:MAG: response regulator [Planctomycetota bacterium]|jgi:CheY-like chemotaxis protein